jgi:hypothetical protein
MTAQTADAQSAEFITPNNISSNEPFMFSVTGAVEGVVVDVKTVDGEVVATENTDKFGRVFLPAGLAAGSYLLTATKGSATQIGKVQISKNTFVPTIGMKMLTPIPALNIDTQLRIATRGIDPHPASLKVSASQGTFKMNSMVLSASPNEVVLDRLSSSGVKPGTVELIIENSQTGQSARSSETIAYRATGKLSQKTVLSGTETHLVVQLAPAELSGSVNARVMSGPVTLENGSDQMTQQFTNGVADFKIQTQPGSTGAFNVVWSLEAPWLFNGAVYDNRHFSPDKTVALEDDGFVRFVDEDGRKGKKRVISDEGGVRVEEFRYDDGTYGTWTTTTTKSGKTVSTDSTTPTTADIDTIVEETKTYDKDGEQVSGTRKTWKRKKGGEKTLDKSEKWDKKKGWH